MKNIFLAPRSNETAYKNYISSMQGKIFADIKPFLSDKEAEQLAGDNKYFVWGCQPSLRGRWESMVVGDYVLFYSHGRFISVGTLKFKKYSEALARSLWPESKESGEPWSCVFFVDNVKEINFSLEELNDLTGYHLQQVQGFMRISRPEATANIEARYGSSDAFIHSLVVGITSDDISKIISLSGKPVSDITDEDRSKLDTLTRDKSEEEIQSAIKRYAEKQLNKKPEQIVKIAKAYKRNIGMVQAIKAKYQNKCQICGFTFKTSAGSYYSEAAHIIPISDGRKGVDSPDNIWILCANHHKMLDRGAIQATSRSTYKLGNEEYSLNSDKVAEK